MGQVAVRAWVLPGCKRQRHRSTKTHGRRRERRRGRAGHPRGPAGSGEAFASVLREQILRVHADARTLSPDVDLAALAGRTRGFSGAALASLVNAAAVSAVRRGRVEIAPADVDTALDRAVLGLERRGGRDAEELRVVALHEAGHAIVAARLLGDRAVHKVSIVARGASGGWPSCSAAARARSAGWAGGASPPAPRRTSRPRRGPRGPWSSAGGCEREAAPRPSRGGVGGREGARRPRGRRARRPRPPARRPRARPRAPRPARPRGRAARARDAVRRRRGNLFSRGTCSGGARA